MKLTKKAQKLRADAEARLAKARAEVQEYYAKKEAYPPNVIAEMVRAKIELTDANSVR